MKDKSFTLGYTASSISTGALMHCAHRIVAITTVDPLFPRDHFAKCRLPHCLWLLTLQLFPFPLFPWSLSMSTGHNALLYQSLFIVNPSLIIPPPSHCFVITSFSFVILSFSIASFSSYIAILFVFTCQITLVLCNCKHIALAVVIKYIAGSATVVTEAACWHSLAAFCLLLLLFIHCRTSNHSFTSFLQRLPVCLSPLPNCICSLPGKHLLIVLPGTQHCPYHPINCRLCRGH